MGIPLPLVSQATKAAPGHPVLVPESDTASGRPLEVGHRSTAEATLLSGKACPAGGLASWEGSGGLMWHQQVPRSFPIVFLGWNQLCLSCVRNAISFGVNYAPRLSLLNCEMKERFLKRPQASEGKEKQ